MNRIKKWLGIVSPSVEVNELADMERRRIERILKGAGFRDYERPEGLRGTADMPEYRITDFWGGCPVDEGFTFSKEHAAASMAGGFDQAYDVELHVRTDGDWRLLERREQPAATPTRQRPEHP